MPAPEMKRRMSNTPPPDKSKDKPAAKPVPNNVGKPASIDQQIARTSQGDLVAKMVAKNIGAVGRFALRSLGPSGLKAIAASITGNKEAEKENLEVVYEPLNQASKDMFQEAVGKADILSEEGRAAARLAGADPMDIHKRQQVIRYQEAIQNGEDPNKAARKYLQLVNGGQPLPAGTVYAKRPTEPQRSDDSKAQTVKQPRQSYPPASKTTEHPVPKPEYTPTLPTNLHNASSSILANSLDITPEYIQDAAYSQAPETPTQNAKPTKPQTYEELLKRRKS